MTRNARAWISSWTPWPLAVLNSGALASIAYFGPITGSALVAGGLLFLACTVATAGFVLWTVVVSQISEPPGLSTLTVFGLKWGISAVLFGLMIVRSRLERWHLDFSVDRPESILLLLSLWYCICSAFSLHPLATFVEGLRIAAYPLLVIVVRETLTNYRAVIVTLLGYGLAGAIGTIYSASGAGDSVGRYAGFFGNANSFGLFLSYAIPVQIAAFFAIRAWAVRGLLLGTSALSLAGLILSQSRASLLSVMVQAVVVAILFKKIRLLVIAMVLGLTLIAAVFLNTPSRNAILTAVRLQSGTTHRTVVWSTGIEGALNSPIVGYGTDLRVGDVASDVMWGDWAQAFVLKSMDDPFYPHNLYIYVMLSAGLPGLVIFGCVIWTMCRRHLHSGRTSFVREFRIGHYTIVAMIIGSLFNGVFEAAALIGKGAINNYFWIAVGIVAACENLERRSQFGRVVDRPRIAP